MSHCLKDNLSLESEINKGIIRSGSNVEGTDAEQYNNERSIKDIAKHSAAVLTPRERHLPVGYEQAECPA